MSKEEKVKIFKDPIYGYIPIPVDYIEKIIDHSSFQRLRDIIQTSYSSLYSGSLHNRFTHSLGVYHLGRIAIKSVCKTISTVVKRKIGEKNIERYRKTFLLACIMHDIGHSPFSHSGEEFYKLQIKETLDEQLGKVINNKNVLKNMPGPSANPHEIMSAIVGLKVFEDYMNENNIDRELFARCITGYLYNKELSGNAYTVDYQFKDCLIKLLNSSLIDVDRLDYLIRDSYMTGYQNVSIDYERLLKSLLLVKYNDSLNLAYDKSGMSIIENVLFAHDNEKKWVQGHPVVLYENALVCNAISKVFDHFVTMRLLIKALLVNRTLYGYYRILIFFFI
jgi:HD superfamily phosphohydrolase